MDVLAVTMSELSTSSRAGASNRSSIPLNGPPDSMAPGREQEGKITAPWNKADCRVCGEEHKQEQISRHRLIPKRFGGSDDEKNVINVCSNCHRTLRDVYDNGFWNRVEDNYQLDSFDFSTESDEEGG